MPDPNEDKTKENYNKWQLGLPRKPANPFADPDSPESKAVRDGSGVPGLKPQSTILDLTKECRDGGKGRKDDQGSGARDPSSGG